MNHSTASVKNCSILTDEFQMAVGFPSTSYFLNHVLACAVNAILTITATFLNLLTILAYWNSRKLKQSMSYFLIMLLSVSDLGASLVCGTAFTVLLAAEIAGTGACVPVFLGRKSIVLAGLSVTVLSVINFERYMGVIHPVIHRVKVTRQRLLVIVMCIWFLWFAVWGISFVKQGALQRFIMINFSLFLLTTVYVNIRIFCTYKQSSRRYISSQSPGTQNNVNTTSRADTVEEIRKRKQFAKDMKLVKSCLTVVVCFFVSLMPIAVRAGVDITDFYHNILFRTWSVTFLLMNPSLNSIIFFWKNRDLRNEAKIILRQVCCN